MIKNTLCAVMLLCGVSSAAMADPVVLEAAQMDAVTAGADATAGSLALAAGAFVVTGTSTTSNVAAYTVSGPYGGSYDTANVAVAESVGTATAFGPTADVATAATTSASVPGTRVLVIGMNTSRQVGGTSISGSVSVAYGTYEQPFFR